MQKGVSLHHFKIPRLSAHLQSTRPKPGQRRFFLYSILLPLYTRNLYLLDCCPEGTYTTLRSNIFIRLDHFWLTYYCPKISWT